MRGALLPSLEELKERVNDAVHNNENDSLTNQAELDKVSEQTAEINGKIVAAERTLAKAQTNFEQSQQMMRSEQASWGDSLDELQADAVLVHEQIESSQQSVQQRTAEYAHLEEELESKIQHEQEQMHHLIVSTVEMCANHKTRVEQAVNEYTRSIDHCKK